MSPQKLLLKGGILLIHDESGHVRPTKSDMLIDQGRIQRISSSIVSTPDVEVWHCEDKLISPGYVDTHHHLWQEQLKGKHANHTLLQYFPVGNFTSSLYEPKDVFWGQLSGALEALDAGTTTVVDHSHINYSPNHAYSALNATVTSGLRSVWCYCPTPRLANWEPFTLEHNFFPPFVMETFDALAAKAPFGQGRVNLGFAFDGLYLPDQVLQPLFRKVRDAGVQVVTTHSVGGPMTGHASSSNSNTVSNTVSTLQNRGLLSHDILLSHSNHLDTEDIKLLSSSGASISATPTTELQMGMSSPVALREDVVQPAGGVSPPKTSLGIDCQTAGSSYIPFQMNLCLQHARHSRHAALESAGKWARNVKPTVEEVFNLGTVDGARAIRMEKEIGRLAEGYRADFVVYDMATPGMLAAAEEDPVAAIVLHSSVADVESVVVDGVARKRGGKLVGVEAESAGLGATDHCLGGMKNGENVDWRQVATRLLKSREGLVKKMEKLDFGAAEEKLLDAFHFDQNAMVTL